MTWNEKSLICVFIAALDTLDFLHRPRNTVGVNNPTDPADEEVIEDDSEERR